MTANAQDFYYNNPRQVKQFIVETLQAGLVPYVKSSPGGGKSSLFRQTADDFNLELIDHRLSTSAPEDMTGLPHFKDGKALFAPFEGLFPIEDTPLPEGKDGWLLFLDEFNACDRSIQAAAYKLVLDRMTGQKKLHPRVLIGAAGNFDTDRAITNPIGTAMQSRVIHLNMKPSYQVWLEDVAIPQDYDHRLIAFVARNPNEHLSNFRPDHNDDTFVCPRTLEFLNKLVKGKEVKPEKTSLYMGAVGPLALTFVGFCAVEKELISIDQIMQDENLNPPSGADAKWMTISYLSRNTDDKNFEKVSAFVGKFDLSMKVLYYRMLRHTKPELRAHPVFIERMIEIDKYLNDRPSI